MGSVQLWEIEVMGAVGMSSPRFIGEDFDVVLNFEEKFCWLPVLDVEHEYFETFISFFYLIEISFKGRLFTWWNNKAGNV